MSDHWLTVFDENGDTHGAFCDCSIGADHLPSGKLFPEEELNEQLELFEKV
jgi:hypothetical protein